MKSDFENEKEAKNEQGIVWRLVVSAGMVVGTYETYIMGIVEIILREVCDRYFSHK